MASRWKWYHGVAFYAGVSVVQLALREAAQALAKDRVHPPEDGPQDRASYEAMRLPPFAPPALAFPIAWGVNAFSQIAGLIHVANLPAETPGRTAYLRLAAPVWLLYASFDAAYFGLRSPLNALGVTAAYTGAVCAMLGAARRTHSTYAAGSLVTTLLWLGLANPVAVAQALWNRDPLWRVGPFTRESGSQKHPEH